MGDLQLYGMTNLARLTRLILKCLVSGKSIPTFDGWPRSANGPCGSVSPRDPRQHLVSEHRERAAAQGRGHQIAHPGVGP
jgi:hypothetical protein